MVVNHWVIVEGTKGRKNVPVKSLSDLFTTLSLREIRCWEGVMKRRPDHCIKCFLSKVVRNPSLMN